MLWCLMQETTLHIFLNALLFPIPLLQSIKQNDGTLSHIGLFKPVSKYNKKPLYLTCFSFFFLFLPPISWYPIISSYYQARERQRSKAMHPPKHYTTKPSRTAS